MASEGENWEGKSLATSTARRLQRTVSYLPEEAMRILATASILSLAFVTPGFTQSPNQAAQSAQTGNTANPCQLMTREEMELCKRTKKGDVSGARSSQCEVLSATEIESCLRQSQTNATAGATGSTSPQPQSDARPTPTEPQERSGRQ